MGSNRRQDGRQQFVHRAPVIVELDRRTHQRRVDPDALAGPSSRRAWLVAASDWARIANASFLKTMYEALKICMPITLMTFAIFTRSNMVVNPGWQQVADTLLVLVSTCGITFAMFGRFHEKPGIDIPLRVLLALVSFVTMFHPDTRVSAAAAIAVLVALGFGVWRHRAIAPPKAAAQVEAAAASTEALASLLAEARRDVS